jgi:hypothetical protein
MRALAVVRLNRPLPCCRSLTQATLTSDSRIELARSCPPTRFLALWLRRVGGGHVSVGGGRRELAWYHSQSQDDETGGASMSGPEHYRRAAELAAEAHRLLGQGDGQATAGACAAVAQAHAVLALAAATAIGASGADTRAWADLTGTGFGSGRGDH